MNVETSTTATQKPPTILLSEQEIGDLIDMLSCGFEVMKVFDKLTRPY